MDQLSKFMEILQAMTKHPEARAVLWVGLGIAGLWALAQFIQAATPLILHFAK